jgi:transcriptional regulator with XRE-family HTH domain
MAKEGEALGAFIREQMRARRQTERAFAQMCNMAQATVNSYLSDNPPTPTIDTLIKISDGTGVDLLIILALTFPQIGDRLDTPADVMLLARALVNLPDNLRNGILAMARSMQEGSGKDKRPDDL